MKLELLRFSSGKESTLGLLFLRYSGRREFLSFTLEDEARTIKIYGKTRIPAGVYEIGLRKIGGMHTRYTKLFDFHVGMIEIKNVPNFKNVLIHIGNTDDDTAGCILTGNALKENVSSDGFISYSKDAYERIYKIITNIMNIENNTKNNCFLSQIEIIDFDGEIKDKPSKFETLLKVACESILESLS